MGQESLKGEGFGEEETVGNREKDKLSMTEIITRFNMQELLLLFCL